MAIETVYLTALVFGVALLYSSVGHGGASGYLAVMGLIGMTESQMKPTALILNILVAGVGSYRYLRAQCFDWRTFWPFAAGSIPFAFFGGTQKLSGDLYRQTLGIVLIVAAIAMVVRFKNDEKSADVPVPIGAAAGMGIGFISGLIGVGGGIFLSPLLILTRWATTKQTLGISSLFILVNSVAGLLGHLSNLQSVPIAAAYIAPAALLGGLLGSWLGSRRLGVPALRILLSAVLATASFKLIKR